jgi:hypothetical protein
MFLTFLLGSFAAILLAVQPEWRSREDTARALVAICVFGTPLVGLTVAVVGSAPWRRWVRTASLAAYGTMVACYSLIYMVMAMPDWLTTIEHEPGAAEVRQLTDIAWVLLIGSLLTALGGALILAILVLAAAVSSRPARKRAEHSGYR